MDIPPVLPPPPTVAVSTSDQPPDPAQARRTAAPHASPRLLSGQRPPSPEPLKSDDQGNGAPSPKAGPVQLTALLDQYARKGGGVAVKLARLAALAGWVDNCKKDPDWTGQLECGVWHYLQQLDLQQQLQLLANFLSRNGDATRLRQILRNNLCKPMEPEQSPWTSPLTLLGVLKAQLVAAMGTVCVSTQAWDALVPGLEYEELCRYAQALRGTDLRDLVRRFDKELIERLRKDAAAAPETCSRRQISAWRQRICASGLSDEVLSSHGLSSLEELEVLRWNDTVKAVSDAWTKTLEALCDTDIAELQSKLDTIAGTFRATMSSLFMGEDDDPGWMESFPTYVDQKMHPAQILAERKEKFVAHALYSLGQPSGLEKAQLELAERRLGEIEDFTAAVWEIYGLLSSRLEG